MFCSPTFPDGWLTKPPEEGFLPTPTMEYLLPVAAARGNPKRLRVHKPSESAALIPEQTK